MRKAILLLGTVALLSCDKEPESPSTLPTPPAPPTDTAANKLEPKIKTGLKLIPPVTKGKFDEMWSGLRDVSELYVPEFGVLEALAKMKPGEVGMKASDIQQKYLYVRQKTPQGVMSFFAVFSDSKIFDEGATFQNIKPEAALMNALFDPEADGIYFNPISRVSSGANGERAYGTNKFGISEIIGYLKVTKDQPDKPFHALANRARKQKKPYETLYYWGMSRREPRPNDDWKEAELAKLWAYHKLNFPGSRERAVGELEWFLKEHGETPRGKRMLNRFKQN